MRVGRQIQPILCCLFFSSGLFAAKITGTVINGTTGKPAVGEEVVSLSLARGMDETFHTKTGSNGSFTLEVPDEGAQHLVRVGHQGVNYFQAAPQGATSVDLTVYDAAKTIDHLVGEGRVFEFQALGNELEVSERYILQNQSQPPRTWMGDHTLEVVVPEGAKIQEGVAAGPGGMPVTSPPIPTGKPNHYAFVYPIRPGRTELRLTYKLPYSGSHGFSLTPGMPLEELGVMLAKGMSFTSNDGTLVHAPDVDGMTVFVAKNLAAAQQISFSVSGQGVAPDEGQSGGEAAATPAAPGGGLGAPIGSPEPLGNARWYILGGVIVILAAFAVWIVRRRPGAEDAHVSSSSAAGRASLGKRRTSQGKQAAARLQPKDTVMEALKDELFQLETDRVEGKISEQDYAAAKAGLDTLFRRHMKKKEEAAPS